MRIKKGVIFLLLMLVLLLFLLTFNKSEEVKVLQTIVPKEKPINKKKNKETFDIDQFMQKQKKEQEQRKTLEFLRDEEDKELSYLSAYRNYVFFKSCEYAHEIQKMKTGKLSEEARFNNFYVEKQQVALEPTEVQLRYLVNHEKKCKQLPYDKNGFFTRELYALERRYQQIQPVSKNEIELNRALKVVTRFHQLEIQVDEGLKGKNKNQQLFFDLRKQLLGLRKELSQRRKLHSSNFDSLDIQLAGKSKDAKINEIEDKIRQVERLIEENKFIDFKVIEEDKEQLNVQYNLLINYLKIVKSPDAFLLIVETLDGNFKKKNSLISRDFFKSIQSKFQFFDKKYFKLMNKVTFSLFACSLGYPCDADSPIVESLCLDYRNVSSFQSCDKNLESFYLDYFLSYNQIEEVDSYFSFLENINEL